MDNLLISICITSYNRPNELKRCLESIDINDTESIEIIISEDVSPKREEIRTIIDNFKSNSRYHIVDNYNETNLGYDRNLKKLISLAKGKYILFSSDDDSFNKGCLGKMADMLKQSNDYGLVYTAYSSNDNQSLNRKYDSDFQISKTADSVSKYLYDGILFSGLIFRRENVKDFDAERFVNMNYFQIYMVMKMIYHYGAFYKNVELINCIGDGENGYGTTELSQKDVLLADRNSVFSNLQFNKGLIKVIKTFDEEEKTSIINSFENEFSLRSYRGLARARSVDRKTLSKYWTFMHDMGIAIKFPANVYYLSLLIFNTGICDKLFSIPRYVVFKIRRQK